MRVLVFGGTGWLGHNIAAVFSAGRHETLICSRGRKTAYPLPAGAAVLRADKDDPEAVREIFRTTPCDIVIDTRPSVRSVKNIAGFAGNRLKHYIHCSSTGGYAPLAAIPGNESCPYRPFRGGWAEKCDVDALAMELFHRNGFPATILRPCYITGPGLLPLDNLGGRREDFLADLKNGVTLDLPDTGRALLQPVEVTDLASAFELAAENFRTIGRIYNICSDHAVTLNRYLQLNAGVFGVEARLHHLPLEEMVIKYRGVADEIGLRFLAEHMCFDISAARRELGYEPRFSPEEAIESTARHAGRLLGLL